MYNITAINTNYCCIFSVYTTYPDVIDLTNVGFCYRISIALKNTLFNINVSSKWCTRSLKLKYGFYTSNNTRINVLYPKIDTWLWLSNQQNSLPTTTLRKPCFYIKNINTFILSPWVCWPLTSRVLSKCSIVINLR